jgi:hypothetical protein
MYEGGRMIESFAGREEGRQDVMVSRLPYDLFVGCWDLGKATM